MGHATDSMARRIGPSVVHRIVPRRVADTSYMQALLEDLANPSIKEFERDRISKEITAEVNLQRSGNLGKGN